MMAVTESALLGNLIDGARLVVHLGDGFFDAFVLDKLLQCGAGRLVKRLFLSSVVGLRDYAKSEVNICLF